MLKFILIFLLLLNVFTSGAQKCTPSSLKKIDGDVAKLVTIGNSGRKFPESKGSELKIYCSQSATYTKNIENFKNKCMKNLPKQVTGIMLYSIKNTINQLCKKDSKRLTNLIDSAKCVNTANPQINVCYTKFIDVILGMVHAPDNRKIPFLCCQYDVMINCVETRTSSIDVCTEQKIQNFIDFVISIVGDVVKIFCTEYIEGSDKCEKLGPPPKKLKSQKRTKSFLMPMIDVFESFPEV